MTRYIKLGEKWIDLDKVPSINSRTGEITWPEPRDAQIRKPASTVLGQLAEETT